MLESSRLWASWDLDWSVPIADLDGVPRVEDNKLVLKLRKVSESGERELRQLLFKHSGKWWLWNPYECVLFIAR